MAEVHLQDGESQQGYERGDHQEHQAARILFKARPEEACQGRRDTKRARKKGLRDSEPEASLIAEGNRDRHPLAQRTAQQLLPIMRITKDARIPGGVPPALSFRHGYLKDARRATRRASADRGSNHDTRTPGARTWQAARTPRRITHLRRVAMIVPARFFDWREALIVVKHETFIKWDRSAFRMFWRWK